MRFQGIFENASKEKRELLFIVTPSFSVIRTNGLEPSRCYSLEPETSASTNSATCALECVRGDLTTFCRTMQAKFCKKCKKVRKSAKNESWKRKVRLAARARGQSLTILSARAHSAGRERRNKLRSPRRQAPDPNTFNFQH